MANRNYLTGDFLALFEERVRNEGAWCDLSVKDEIRHKFICKNPISTLAISLCGQKIASIEKLHENVLSKKCLVCDLFDTREGEKNQKLFIALSQIVDKKEKNQTQNKDE